MRLSGLGRLKQSGESEGGFLKALRGLGLQLPPNPRLEIPETPKPIKEFGRGFMDGPAGLAMRPQGDDPTILQGLGAVAGEYNPIALGSVMFPAAKRVFHGTNNTFNKMSSRFTQQNDLLGDMFHFAEDPRFAEKFAKGSTNSQIRQSSLDSPFTLDLTRELPTEDLDILHSIGIPEHKVQELAQQARNASSYNSQPQFIFDKIRRNMGAVNSGDVLPGSPYTGVRYHDAYRYPPAWAVPNSNQEKLDKIYNIPNYSDIPEEFRNVEGIRLTGLGIPKSNDPLRISRTDNLDIHPDEYQEWEKFVRQGRRNVFDLGAIK